MKLFSVLWVAALGLFQTFVQGTATSASECVGEGAADVVFLLDSSYSVWRSDFRRQLTFVQEVIDRLPIGPNNIRVAIVTYADYPQLQFHLHHYSVKPDLRAAVEGIRQRGGFQTVMGDAIRFVRRNVFEVGSRSRPLGVNVVQVAVVITDGRLDNRTATGIEAELAKQEGVLVFVVGVGKDVDLDELKGIGSMPSEYYTFLVDSFAGLARVRDLLATKTCKVAESVRSAAYTTAATSADTRAVLMEASFSKAPLIEEMSTKPTSNNKASLTKSSFTDVHFEDVASTKTASVKATLTKLVLAGVDSTSTTATTTSLPSKAPYNKSTITRSTLAGVGSSKATSTTAVSAAVAISPVASTAKYYTTSTSVPKLFSETSMLPHENVSLAPSTGIAGAQGSRNVEALPPHTKGDGATELPTAVAISDGGVQTVKDETVAFQQPRNIFQTNTSEGADELIATWRGFRAGEDITDMDGTQRRQEVLTNGNYSWDEPRVLTRSKKMNDEDSIDRGPSRDGNVRLNYEPGHQVNDFWRLDNMGMLMRCRKVSQGADGKEITVCSRMVRLEPKPRRGVLQRSEGTQSSADDDRRDLDRSHFNREMTDEENRGNVSDGAHRDHTTFRSRPITRTKGRRGGFARGSEMQGTIRKEQYAALIRKNHDLPHHHRPPVYTNGYWRLNDLDKLVWYNSTQNSLLPSRNNATDSLNIKSTDVPTMKTLNTGIFKNNTDFPHTQSHLEADEVYRLATSSDAQPRLDAANSLTPRASFDDVIKSLSKQTTRTADEQRRSTRPPVPSSQEIDNHNPKKGFWKYDRNGQHGVWVSYKRNDDVISTGGTTDAPAMTYANVNPTSGTKGPSLVDSDKLSYGYWKQEKGKLVWYEYRSPGIYRKVIDTDPLAIPNKVRIELPPGRMPRCRGCNLTSSPVWYGHGQVNQSASSEEMVVFRASDRMEKLVLNRTRPSTLDDKKNRDLWEVLLNLKQSFSEGLSENSNSSQFNTSAKSRIEEISTLLDRIENRMSVVHRYNRSFLSSSDHGFNKISFQSSPLDSVVQGMNGTGNNKRNWTSENMESVWIRGFKETDKGRGRSHRTRITTGMQHELGENHGSSSVSVTVNPRRDGTIWSAKATRSVSSLSPTRRQLEPRNPNRVGDTVSAQKEGSSFRQNPAPVKSNRKHAKRCVPRRPLDVVFVVDPRARMEPYTKQLWQLAYKVVLQLQMEDDRVRVRFYPELEEVKVAATNGSAESGSVQTVIQKVVKKPVPELLRMVSRLLAKPRKGLRRIGIYLTDGSSGAPLDLERAAEEVKTDAAVELFAVGVGQETDPAELETIADAKLKGKHLYRLNEPLRSDIDTVAMKLARALCGRR